MDGGNFPWAFLFIDVPQERRDVKDKNWTYSMPMRKKIKGDSLVPLSNGLADLFSFSLPTVPSPGVSGSKKWEN
jgi:hypothetical protein